MSVKKEVLPDEEIPVSVQPPQEQISFRTSIEFHDKDKGKRIEVSVVTPNITPVGNLQFLTKDSLINYPMSGIFRYEIKQVVEKQDAKIII